MIEEFISLAIVTPNRILFEGIASHVQIPAADGYMGFLPRHAPLISPLGTGLLQFILNDGSRKYFAISGGYFEIHNDNMIILADVAEEGDEIDIERAQRARDRAIELLKDAGPGKGDMDRARAALLRALNRIKTAELVSESSLEREQNGT